MLHKTHLTISILNYFNKCFVCNLLYMIVNHCQNKRLYNVLLSCAFRIYIYRIHSILYRGFLSILRLKPCKVELTTRISNYLFWLKISRLKKKYPIRTSLKWNILAILSKEVASFNKCDWQQIIYYYQKIIRGKLVITDYCPGTAKSKRFWKGSNHTPPPPTKKKETKVTKLFLL